MRITFSNFFNYRDTMKTKREFRNFWSRMHSWNWRSRYGERTDN